MDNLEPGYYWVKDNQGWRIAEYAPSIMGRLGFYFTGDDMQCSPEGMSEIDPRPIRREEP